MAKEIERKFLVDLNRAGPLIGGVEIFQGYLPVEGLTVVRVRIAGHKAFLTIKGANEGLIRNEFEYEIPVKDARQIFDTLCLPAKIRKTRYVKTVSGLRWEIDVFHDDNDGLIIAEVELESPDQHINLPDWVLVEVSGNPAYYNSNLLERPYKLWKA